VSAISWQTSSAIANSAQDVINYETVTVK